jgi:hypothetical protein
MGWLSCDSFRSLAIELPFGAALETVSSRRWRQKIARSRLKRLVRADERVAREPLEITFVHQCVVDVGRGSSALPAFLDFSSSFVTPFASNQRRHMWAKQAGLGASKRNHCGDQGITSHSKLDVMLYCPDYPKTRCFLCQLRANVLARSIVPPLPVTTENTILIPNKIPFPMTHASETPMTSKPCHNSPL